MKAVEPYTTETVPPLFLSRANDPTTSLNAAIKAAKASRRAVDAVGRLMADGVDRADHEIHEDLWNSGALRVSDGIVRHARKALSDAGVLIDTGTTRETKYGSASRVWRLS